MASLFLPQASQGLPLDFYEGELYKSHEEAPDRLPVGSIILDRARDVSFILCQADAAINDKRLVQSVAAAVSVSAGTTARGTRGSRVVTLARTGVTADQFKNGSLRTSGDVQYIYKIQSNTATSGGNIEITLTSRLVVDIPATEVVSLRAPVKVRETSVATADPRIALGMSLAAITDEHYFFAQRTGEADIVADDIAQADRFMALTKGDGGRAVNAAAGQQIVAYHSILQPANDINANTIIPVRLAMGQVL